VAAHIEHALAWSDEPDQQWSDEAARALRVRVVPPCDGATEIALEGPCPRCHHQFVSTHPVRAVMSDAAANALAAAADISRPAGYGIRRVTGECSCLHEHSDAPEGRAGCGAPFALWISWSTETCTRSRLRRWLRSLLGRPKGEEREVAPLRSAGKAEPLALEEERQLHLAASTQLADVRKAAESWRTGLAGFLAILVSVFFVKGKDSFDDISGTGWKNALATLLLVSATLALYGAYRALRAAYGTPRDEYLGEISPLFRLLHPTTPRDIYKYGTVSAWHHASARTAVGDLRQAKVATIGSLISFGAAAAITWFAPGPPPPGFVSATYRPSGQPTTTTCGEAVPSPTGTLSIRPAAGSTQTLALEDVRSIKVVASCP
jgi:hypothetical protein